ncbi:hypothetical protein H5410_004388 [Solanum commersonii]|uniref:CCHC-type domain-containing protein n=1 Tax=Solanum commersonii TaxID=4109 RepID=A0A9J6B8B0_SOLCO|nr:hypothetical protein H5410_004388 [Solanum commersonii]
MELPECNSTHWKSKFIDGLPTLFAKESDRPLEEIIINFNRSDTCHKCGRYGHYAKDCRFKEKIKSLDIEDNLNDSLYKIMLNFDSGSGTEYSSEEESLTSEDLKALQKEVYLTSEDEC